MMKEYNKVEWWLVMGAGLGVVIGAALDNVAMGVTFGPAVGLIIWAIFFSGEKTNNEDIKNDNNDSDDHLPPQ
jgi:hypothetical protein